jgi:hypothetical protein
MAATPAARRNPLCFPDEPCAIAVRYQIDDSDPSFRAGTLIEK